MNTKFSTTRAVEKIVRQEGPLDETFSTYVRVLCRKRGISRQDLAQRLGIERQTVTYLFNGLYRHCETPEYLLRAMEKEFGLTYNEFIGIFSARFNVVSIPNDISIQVDLVRKGDEQVFSVSEDQEEDYSSCSTQRNPCFNPSTIKND